MSRATSPRVIVVAIGSALVIAAMGAPVHGADPATLASPSLESRGLLSVTLLPPTDESQGAQLVVRWNGEPGARLMATFTGPRGEPQLLVAAHALVAGINLLPLALSAESSGTLRLEVHDATGGLLATWKEGVASLRDSSGFAWKSTFVDKGLDGTVKSMVVWDDGRGPALYVGGDFIFAGNHVVNHVARWDGTEWGPLAGASGVGVTGGTPWVESMTVYDGGLVVGGFFVLAGGELAYNIARWDGQDWSALGHPQAPGLNSVVQALTVHDGALVAGGWFTQTRDGSSVNHIARWDGSRWSPFTTPTGRGMNETVTALTVYGGELVAGGGFTLAGGAQVPYIARWSAGEWLPLGDAVAAAVDQGVAALVIYQGDLVAGGWFREAGGLEVNHVARWDGSHWSSLSGPTGTGTAAPVLALSVHQDRLVAAGSFSHAGGVEVQHIASWDGGQWVPFTGPSGTGMNQAVEALATFKGELVAGGWFREAGGTSADFIARWNGGAWGELSDVGQPTALNGMVRALAVYDGDLVAGGVFTEAGRATVNHIARWDGSEWSPLAGPEGVGVDHYVNTLAVFDGHLVAGGWFSEAGGVLSEGVARWDGARWHPFGGPEEGLYGVQALTVHGGELFAGGQFAGTGIELGHVARWDGSRWRPLLGPQGIGANEPVQALTSYGGDLVAGGMFTHAGGIEVNHIARWDGSRWFPLPGPTGVGTNGFVYALATHQGELIAGGAFTEAGGLTVSHIARWSGGQWSAFPGVSGPGISGGVGALGHYRGDLVAAGGFIEAGGVPVNRIARWNGEEWLPLSGPSGSGTNSAATALAEFREDLAAGGGFYLTGGVLNHNLALYGPILCVPDARTLCIDDQPGDRRFEVRLDYQTVQAGGLAGQGQAVPLAGLGLSRGGLFHFGNPTNPEMLLKVLDGCAINGRRWVFYSAGTNLGFVVKVRDTHSGQVARYQNADLIAAAPAQDTSAFQCSPGTAGKNDPWSGAASAWAAAEAISFDEVEGRSGGACVTDQHVVCIDQRFRIEIDYHTSQAGGLSGAARAIPLSGVGVHRGGLFYFVDPTNPEVLIKVLDGCAINGRYWVFYSAGTNLGLQVKVTDTVTGYEVEYTNPDLTAAPPIQDTSALPCG